MFITLLGVWFLQFVVLAFIEAAHGNIDKLVILGAITISIVLICTLKVYSIFVFIGIGAYIYYDLTKTSEACKKILEDTKQ